MDGTQRKANVDTLYFGRTSLQEHFLGAMGAFFYPKLVTTRSLANYFVFIKRKSFFSNFKRALLKLQIIYLLSCTYDEVESYIRGFSNKFMCIPRVL